MCIASVNIGVAIYWLPICISAEQVRLILEPIHTCKTSHYESNQIYRTILAANSIIPFRNTSCAIFYFHQQCSYNSIYGRRCYNP